ncbi:hypothetical protein LJB42_001033 [Komagataella kurtzmanii]|nr:hypothetical protein LJB42_001033 [Komagataella kurtzmanii]
MFPGMDIPTANYSEEDMKAALQPTEPEFFKVKVSKKRKTRRKIKHDTTASTIRRHISESKWTISNWYRHIHWKNVVLVVIVPLLALVGSLTVPLTRTGFYWMGFNYIITCTFVIMGYHRYWAHRSFQTTKEMSFLFAMVGASAGVGSAKWWCASHRAHHRFCDTERDPHNIRKGFWYSHFGWMLLIHHPKLQAAIKESESEDISSDPVILWQYENYFHMFLVTGILIPAIIGWWLFEDFAGGLVYGGLVKIFLVQNTIFSVNSLCHCCGDQPFDDAKSSRNSILLSLITFGEGQHNFHHEFPSDCRNGVEWYDFDPVKWVIFTLNALGVIYNVHATPSTAINQLRVQQAQRILDKERSQLNWGIRIDKLPTLTSAEFSKLAKESQPERALVVISGIVHDVTPFLHDHPGGVALIKSSIGKDATNAFNGAVYSHSNAARNLLATMRIAVILGSEQEVWKQQQKENKDVPLKNDSEGKKIVRSGEQITMTKTPSTTAGAA